MLKLIHMQEQLQNALKMVKGYTCM